MKVIFRNMNFLFVAVAFVCLQFVGGTELAIAQSPFSGRGIPSGSGEAETKSGWLSSDSSGQSTSSGIRLPWSKENKSSNVVEPTSSSTGLFGFPKPTWMQPRDPNAPTMMQQASERTKALWGRTQEGISHFGNKTSESFKTMNQNIRTATSESWARITGSAKSPDTRGGEVKPPVGDNESWLNKNKDR